MDFKSIPVVDLFAGPGGLAEGFSSVETYQGNRVFDVRVSIEKDPKAYRTLFLRALFRSFPTGGVPDAYYDYIRGSISREELLDHPSVRGGAELAAQEARHATLGETSPKEIDGWIRTAIGDSDPWVLIGGPPCQAYSIAGRSRMRGADPAAFEEDKRHFLYREYLRIIREFAPAVFVMENVKGILSSTHGGGLIFGKILEDLAKPGGDHKYDIRSFTVARQGDAISPRDFIIESENFGIPQMRHRVILFGVRKDRQSQPHNLLIPTTRRVSVLEALSGLPPLRSRLSREPDSFAAWLQVMKQAPQALKGWTNPNRSRIEARMAIARKDAESHESFGSAFVHNGGQSLITTSTALGRWYQDSKLDGVCQHETRSHMRSDLHRYLFAACYAAEFQFAPKLALFPQRLLPAHVNVDNSNVPFSDRFRVQIGHLPSTTVVSHISKDGHYYIHPDPAQCRSLTVREAARLQTFPDNYFFEGNRTEQYTQVGNAVPPYLARQLAGIVADFLTSAMPETQSDLRQRNELAVLTE